MTTPPQTPTRADYHDLNGLLWNGEIGKASKADLERYAVMLSLPSASAHFNVRQYEQVCETVRTLLVVRMSEEANAEATRNSRIALLVAIGALCFSVLQVFSPLFFRLF